MHFTFASEVSGFKKKERKKKPLADRTRPISVLQNLDLSHLSLPISFAIPTPVSSAHWDMPNDSLAFPWVWREVSETQLCPT